jgi:hypothetical protein
MNCSQVLNERDVMGNAIYVAPGTLRQRLATWLSEISREKLERH